MNSDGDKVYKEIVAEHNMKRQKKDKIYKTSSIVSRGMFYVASVLLILYSIINYYYVNHRRTAVLGAKEITRSIIRMNDLIGTVALFAICLLVINLVIGYILKFLIVKKYNKHLDYMLQIDIQGDDVND